MNTLTKTLFALAFCVGSAWAGDPPDKKEVPLPAPIVKAEEAMNDAVAKARANYLKQVEAEVKKLQATLEREKAAATRAGQLEVAMAIKAKQDALVVAEVAQKALEGAGDLLGEAKKGLTSEKDILAFLAKNPKWVRVENGTSTEAIIDVKKKTFTYLNADGTINSSANFTISKDGIFTAWDETSDFSAFDGTKCPMKRKVFSIGFLSLK
jgi:hypothetical protein